VNIKPLALAAALATFSSAALATGWDWDEEDGFRIWRPSSLQWAQAVDPQHPSIGWINANVAPPPREMWCVGAPAPTETDCDIHYDLTEDWLVAFLGLSSPSQLPQYLPPFPAECTSICSE
jgi:hypothetical protein